MTNRRLQREGTMLFGSQIRGLLLPSKAFWLLVRLGRLHLALYRSGECVLLQGILIHLVPMLSVVSSNWMSNVWTNAVLVADFAPSGSAGWTHNSLKWSTPQAIQNESSVFRPSCYKTSLNLFLYWYFEVRTVEFFALPAFMLHSVWRHRIAVAVSWVASSCKAFHKVSSFFSNVIRENRHLYCIDVLQLFYLNLFMYFCTSVWIH